MSVPCLHYSRFYKEKIISGKISGAILKGEWSFPKGSDVFIYVTESDSVEEGTTDHKVGIAKIQSSAVVKVADLTEAEAKATAYTDRDELLEAIKKWHELDETGIVTFLSFEFATI